MWKIYILYAALLDNWEDTAAVEQKRKGFFFFLLYFLKRRCEESRTGDGSFSKSLYSTETKVGLLWE